MVLRYRLNTNSLSFKIYDDNTFKKEDASNVSDLYFDDITDFTAFFNVWKDKGYVFTSLKKINIGRSDLTTFPLDTKILKFLFPNWETLDFERGTMTHEQYQFFKTVVGSLNIFESATVESPPSTSHSKNHKPLTSVFANHENSSIESSSDSDSEQKSDLQVKARRQKPVQQRTFDFESSEKESPAGPPRAARAPRALGRKKFGRPNTSAASSTSSGSSIASGTTWDDGISAQATSNSKDSFFASDQSSKSSSSSSLSSSESGSDFESSLPETPAYRHRAAGTPVKANPAAMQMFQTMRKSLREEYAQKATHTQAKKHPLAVSSPKQEERPPEEIRGAIADTIKTNAPDSEQQYSTEIAYTRLDTDRETGVKLYYKDSKKADKVCVLVATSDTVYVSPQWKNMDKKTSLDQKALMVLGSLGIPPCPEQIDISNEHSGLGKRVRAVFEELKASQEATLVVSTTQRSRLS